MTDENNSSLDSRYNSALFWGKETPSIDVQMRELLTAARKLKIKPFIDAICCQLFDHSEPEKLIGWQAELFIEAASELVYNAASQARTPS